MRAYLAQIDETELRRFIAEDVIPGDLLPQLIRDWTSPARTVVWAVLDDEDAEAVRDELAARRHHDACGVLLDRAVEVHPIVPSEESRRHPGHQA